MISRREIDLSNPSRRFLWLLPERKDFILLANDTCTGLGMLADPKVSELRAFYNALCTRTQQDQILTLSLRTKPLWNILCSTSPLFIRLEQLAMGFRSMCRTVRAIQRDLLEAEAYINYFTKHDICSNYTPTVGAFVYGVEHLQCLQRLGVYHWLIRPYENCCHVIVNDITILQQASDLGLSTDHHPFASPIFKGRSSDPSKYMSIREYGRNCIRFPDPFHSRVLPENLTSSGSLQSQSSSNRQRALTSRQRQLKGSSDRKSRDFF